MIYARLLIAILASFCCWACSDEPVTTVKNNNNNEMGLVNGDMDPDLDVDSKPDTDMPSTDPDGVGRLVIQPVSGAGLVKGAKFRAHIQVGRLVDVTPGK